MNQILAILVLCAASAGCLELENLCSSDSFKYNDILVNAFHRTRLNLTFQPLSHYLINDTVKCDRGDFKNQTNFLKALKTKHA